MIKYVWEEGYIGRVMEFVYIYILIRIINTIHKFCIFNLPNCHSFRKTIYLNFFKYEVHFQHFSSNHYVRIIFEKINILNPIHKFSIFNLPNRSKFSKTIYLNLFNYMVHFQHF